MPAASLYNVKSNSQLPWITSASPFFLELEVFCDGTTELMKRKRARAEDQDVADQPVSEPDLEQSAAEESEGDAEQPTQLASTGDQKRSKLQKRLDKLKDTYDRKGSKLHPEPFLC